MQVKLDMPYFDDIKDDVDFCCKLAKEEKLVILPGELKLIELLLASCYLLF